MKQHDSSNPINMAPTEKQRERGGKERGREREREREAERGGERGCRSINPFREKSYTLRTSDKISKVEKTRGEQERFRQKRGCMGLEEMQKKGRINRQEV